MNQLTLFQIKQEELAILKKVKIFFSLYNIQYTITAGSLLGAVRHGGFIPWDDDIDLMIERNEYLRLIKVLKEDPINNYFSTIDAIGFEMGNAKIPYLKFINREIETNSKDIDSQFLWIDVFPADAIPDHNRILYYRIVKMYYSMFWYKMAQENSQIRSIISKKKERSLTKLYHRFLQLLVTPLSSSFVTDRFISYSSKYHNENTSCLSNNVWGVFDKEEFRREIMNDFTTIRFEDIEVSCMKYYHEWLTIRYGDYMKLPPEEERVSHGIKAHYVDE